MMDMDLLPMVAALVSAQASCAPMTREELTKAIRLVYATLSKLSGEGTAEATGTAGKEPAVAINKSVFPDYIICLEDGKKLKTLKRHLMASYGLSPEQYRARWNLPGTYPLTAPNYTARRSEVARSIGLGRKPGSQKQVPVKRAKERGIGKRGRPRKIAG
jgi:predicted transcriptional regulator